MKKSIAIILLSLTNVNSKIERFPLIPNWPIKLQSEIIAITKKFPGEFGIFVKDLSSNLTYSSNADVDWYLSSSIKVPIAIELFRQIEQGKLTLNDRIILKARDYRDGTGETNWKASGTSLTLKYLLDQMLIFSDNAATDMLINKLGIDNINQMIAQNVKKGFGRIISLLEVRKLVFSIIHPRGYSASNFDFLKLKRFKKHKAKLREFSKIIKVDQNNFITKFLDTAFMKYYSHSQNSATLHSYGQLLEKLFKGKILNQASTKKLIGIMYRCHTGKKRILGGLGKKIKFAHKTGTQYRRMCDMGVANNGIKEVVITVCAKNYSKRSKAEQLFFKVGQAIKRSGILRP